MAKVLAMTRDALRPGARDEAAAEKGAKGERTWEGVVGSQKSLDGSQGVCEGFWPRD